VAFSTAEIVDVAAGWAAKMGSKGSIETCADWTRETMIDFDRCLKVMKRN
jgi:hypothetical protein